MYPVQISNDTKYQTFDQNGMAIIQLSPACDKEMTTAQSDAPVDANLLDNDRQEIGNSTMAFKKFYSLYMGQVLSLLVTMTGVCTTILGRSSGFAAPTTQRPVLVAWAFDIDASGRGGLSPRLPVGRRRGFLARD